MRDCEIGKIICQNLLLDEKDHLAALAKHKALTQARYYGVHKLVESELGQRAVSKLVALKTPNINPSGGMPI